MHTQEDIGQTTLSRQTNVGSGLTTQSRLTAKCNYAQPTLGGTNKIARSEQLGTGILLFLRQESRSGFAFGPILATIWDHRPVIGY